MSKGMTPKQLEDALRRSGGKLIAFEHYHKLELKLVGFKEELNAALNKAAKLSDDLAASRLLNHTDSDYVPPTESKLRRDIASLEDRVSKAEYKMRSTGEDLLCADMEVRNLTGVVSSLARILAENLNTKERRSNRCG